MVKLIISGAAIALSFSSWAYSDPTRPLLRAPAVKKESERTVKTKQPLTAIFTRDKKRFAIIEDKIYRTGDNYRDGKIIRITDDRVILSSAQGVRQLTLIPNIKK